MRGQEEGLNSEVVGRVELRYNRFPHDTQYSLLHCYMLLTKDNVAYCRHNAPEATPGMLLGFRRQSLGLHAVPMLAYMFQCK